MELLFDVRRYRENEERHSHDFHQLVLALEGALGLQVVTSTLMGALLPLVAARFKLDPAVVAAPALSTVVDVTGLLIYFTCI